MGYYALQSSVLLASCWLKVSTLAAPPEPLQCTQLPPTLAEQFCVRTISPARPPLPAPSTQLQRR